MSAPKRKPRTFKVWARIHWGTLKPLLEDVRLDKPPDDFLNFYEAATLTLTGKRKAH
jgi:hypothetical protein